MINSLVKIIITVTFAVAPSGWLTISLLFCQQLIISDNNVSTTLGEHGVVLAAVHPKTFSDPAGIATCWLLWWVHSQLLSVQPVCSDSPRVGSHNSWQMSLMILCLLRPLWVLGETMGRFRPSYPQSLFEPYSVHPPPLSHTYIYILFGWKWCNPHPHPARHPLSCSVMDGEAEVLTLALWGLLCHSPLLSAIRVCLHGSLFLIVLSMCMCVRARVPLL